MSVRYFHVVFVAVLFTVLGVSRVTAQVPPDLILFNGKVFTSDLAVPTAEAIALSGERVSAVGSNAAIRKLAGSNTRMIDLKGRAVVPGFNDAHAHFSPKFQGIDLNFTSMEPTWAEVAEALKSAAGSAPKGKWIFGTIGRDAMNAPLANRKELDAIAPDHPVMLSTYFGHGAVLNSRAMSVLKIREDQPDPLGGHFERESKTKALNGRMFEYAQWNLDRILVEQGSDADLIAEMKKRAAAAAAFGITSMQVMPSISTERYLRLASVADLPIRIRAIAFSTTDTRRRDMSDIDALVKAKPANKMVRASGIKWILDGTPIERGAALRKDYNDRKGWRGTLNFDASEIEKIVRESLQLDQPLLLHCVGDRACEAVFDAMEKVGEGKVNWKEKRVRIEHGEVVIDDLIKRAKQLGVVIVQNPSHFTDGEMGRQRWGGGKAPIRTYIEQGIPFALGSDGPLNPFLNIMFAVTHPDNPAEAISREQAVIAYTSGSAYAEFAEAQKGKLEAGMLADLAVLSQDIFAIKTEQLPATTSVLTIVGGRIVHDAGVLK
ncbi:MAG: amidohydrolase [Acidobacteriota bacterium]